MHAKKNKGASFNLTHAQNSDNSMGKYTPWESTLLTHGKVHSRGCRGRSRYGGGTQPLDPRVHILSCVVVSYTQHIHARTRDMAAQARVLAPDSLPLIGEGSEPKLVPAGSVLQGETIGSRETAPVNQVKSTLRMRHHVPRLLTYMC